MIDYFWFWAAKVLIDAAVIAVLLLLIGAGYLILFMVRHKRQRRKP